MLVEDAIKQANMVVYNWIRVKYCTSYIISRMKTNARFCCLVGGVLTPG